ncbi:D-Ala-D-Ala carboxypeptidase family metallohydrolase [Bacteroides cellulosilyticus]|uniref:Peptidase M15 n=1 Tax=Bacteroides cellulosilyticus DSM 14838 TaxID=537012 RepID=E2N7Y0_9BACE|nr:D-Ala-D-Ala carboxypeptidase family metallohydrolase [Bacteroides cellulosilyticus]EEF91983.1 peptidase M15 [Bacteroides cellulosilyticus DSM 14838]MBN9710404.1 peptidase M15 [Bacteroides cellulosilyticus]MDC7305061.1 D-Ala-D-Ala carboxypeptidase family metallohydrolase [Bacteroides cellulosilyticus DSM 14838]
MKYFTIAELCKSDTADRLGIDNRCKKEHVVNMTALVDNVLDPLREAYRKPITVNSGFRCPALNKAVKGSATSDHMTGRAADITGGSPKENKRLFYLIQSLGLPFKQLIDEKNFSWIHVSYDDGNIKKQVLKL